MRGLSGNFLSCIKCVKDPFKAQEGRWDFSRDAVAEKGLHLALGEKLLFFSRVAAGKLGFLSVDRDLRNRSYCLRNSSLHASCVGPLGIPLSRCWGLCPHLDLRPEPQDSSPEADMHLRVPKVSTGVSGFVSCGDMQVCLSSRAVTVVSGFLLSRHKDLCLSLEVPQGCHLPTWCPVQSSGDG